MDGYGGYYNQDPYYSGGYYDQTPIVANDYGYSDPYYSDRQSYNYPTQDYRGYDEWGYYDDYDYNRRGGGGSRWERDGGNNNNGYNGYDSWDYSDWDGYGASRSPTQRKSDYRDADVYFTETDVDDYRGRRSPSPPRESRRRSSSSSRRNRSDSATVISPDDSASRIDPIRAKATPDDARTVKMKGLHDPRDDETATQLSQRTVRTVMPRTHYVGKDGKKKKYTKKQLRELYELGVNAQGKFKGTLKKHSRHRGVSTQADPDDKVHYVGPYPLGQTSIQEARRRIEKIMKSEIPASTRSQLTGISASNNSSSFSLVRRKADYLRYEILTKTFGQDIDDVEFYFSKFDNMIHCKSVSRHGDDKNRNKQRVARIWSKYQQDLMATQKFTQENSLAAQKEKRSRRAARERERERERERRHRHHRGGGYHGERDPIVVDDGYGGYSRERDPIVVDSRDRYDYDDRGYNGWAERMRGEAPPVVV